MQDLSTRHYLYFAIYFSLIAAFSLLYPTSEIPSHLLKQKASFIPNFLTNEEIDGLREIIFEMADFPSNAQDTQFYNVSYEHIGEAEPINADGSCSKTLLIPNRDRSLCILPGRIDVARHYMIYGGIEALRENPQISFSRLLSFGRYIFDLEQYPLVRKLFESEKFQSAAREICPFHKQILDPFQFNFIIQVPGQTVAIHLDAVYFTWATRFHYPQWLLAVMAFSGAYEDDFVDQIQVVAYLHKWNSAARSGNFVWWTENGDYHIQAPQSGAASIVDGSKTVHAATVYRPETRPPAMDKSADNRLIYKGNDNWHLISNGKILRKYKTDDLRISIVYRARCFESVESKNTFTNNLHEKPLPIEEILSNLTQLMAKRQGRTIKDYEHLSQLELAFALLDEFAKYPIRSSGIPYNYCLLLKEFPRLTPILGLLCS